MIRSDDFNILSHRILLQQHYRCLEAFVRQRRDRIYVVKTQYRDPYRSGLDCHAIDPMNGNLQEHSADNIHAYHCQLNR